MKQGAKKLTAVILILMLTSALFTALLPISAQSDFAGYTEISTKAELNAVRNNLAGKYVLTADIVFTDADFASGGAFYNSGKGWRAIGNDADNPFTGIFDGNGHSITGLKIKEKSNKVSYYGGLFGRVVGGTLKNITMVNSGIELTDSATKNDYRYARAGGIAGSVVDSTLTNCHSSGSISVSVKCEYVGYKNVIPYVGGICGIAANSTLTNCHNTASVSGSASSKDPSADVYCGGIVGYLQDGSTVIGCSNTGAVAASCTNSSSSTSDLETGGIAGCAEGSVITDCYNSGTVTNVAGASFGIIRPSTGGVVGYASETEVSTCRNSGAVSSTSSTRSGSDIFSWTGGIVGSTNYSSTVSNCYNTAAISATAGTIYAEGKVYSGGVTGSLANESSLTYCYNVGKITVDAKIDTRGKARAGGVVGTAGSNTPVTNCYYLKTAITSTIPDNGALTEEQLRQQASYTGFDFDAIWTIDSAASYPYPTLTEFAELFPHNHSWDNKWSGDGNAHWHECTADDCPITENSEKDGYAAHEPIADDGNCLTPINCSVCVRGMVSGNLGHSFTNDCDTTCNSDGCTHTREITHTPGMDDGDCTTEIKCLVCGEVVKPAASAHSYTNSTDTTCDLCGKVRTVETQPAGNGGSGAKPNTNNSDKNNSTSSGTQGSADKDEGGCGAAICGSAVLFASLTAGCAVLFKKKREGR